MLNRRIGPCVLVPAMWFSFKLQPLSSDHGKKSTRGWHITPGSTNFAINPSPVRTLAFEPLGHLPISISEMAN